MDTATAPGVVMYPNPVGDRILVLRDSPETMLRGFHLSKDAQVVPHSGRVLATGPGRQLEDGSRSEMEVVEGDHVYFAGYAGMTLAVHQDTEPILVLRADDIMAVDPR